MRKNPDNLIGFRVITHSLIVGDKIFRKGDIIPAAEAETKLHLSKGQKLVVPVYSDDEPTTSEPETPPARKKPELKRSEG